jgi:protein TonB
METKALVLQHWDDVVFENRNKQYGAYPMRRAYSRRVILALGISVSIIASLLLLSTLKGPSSKIEPPVIPGKVFELSDLPQLPPLKKHAASEPVIPTQTNSNTTPVVVTDDVLPTLDTGTPVELPGDIGDGSVSFTGEGSGVAVIVEPLPVELPKVLDIAEVMPVYEGGHEALMRYILRHMRYPASARRMGIEGTVFVKFVVNGDGSVSDVHVIRGIHPDCDKEAVRIIALLPGWIGGKQGGMPVGVRMVLPIKFRLT